jgi:hypothetical protein
LKLESFSRRSKLELFMPSLPAQAMLCRAGFRQEKNCLEDHGSDAACFTFIKKIINYYITGAERGQMAKPRKYSYLFIAGTCLLLGFIFACCSSNGVNDRGEIFIKVVDAPANYQQINIVVNRISIHQEGASSAIWTYLNADSPVSFNLLTLVNGHSAQLALSKVPAGNYDQIKIEYGTCTITTNENRNPQHLNLDPFIQNGHIISYGFHIVDGEQVQLTIDYDAYSSVYPSGFLNGYILKPKIRIQNTAFSGSIFGTVRDSNNAAAPAKITTFTGLDTVTTYNDTIYGSFQIPDLPEGIYTVVIVPENRLLMNDTLPGNVVIRQIATNLGIIQLKYK